MLYTLSIKRNIEDSCLYASIAHAVSLLKYPMFDYEQSWDGKNYSIQDSQGSRGTISFGDVGSVGAFRNDQFISKTESAETYITAAEPGLKTLAQSEAFLYLLNEVDGVTQPVITTAFWGKDKIFSNHSMKAFKEYSGGIVDFLFLDENEQKAYWREDYEFSLAEQTLVQQIYDIKKEKANEKINLEDFQSFPTNIYDEDGILTCTSSLNEI